MDNASGKKEFQKREGAIQSYALSAGVLNAIARLHSHAASIICLIICFVVLLAISVVIALHNRKSQIPHKVFTVLLRSLNFALTTHWMMTVLLKLNNGGIIPIIAITCLLSGVFIYANAVIMNNIFEEDDESKVIETMIGDAIWFLNWLSSL